MGLGDYGLTIGSATQGFRQQEQDAMKKEDFDIDKEKAQLQLEVTRKSLEKEGFRESLQMVISGDVRGGEDYFNTVGNYRIKPGTLKYNRKDGILSWTDKDGEEKFSDIRMMAAIGGITLPKLPEKGSSLKERKYGLSVAKYNLSQKRRFDKLKKDTRGEVAQLYKGELGDNGVWVVPEGNREPYARAIRVTDMIHEKYPDKYDPGQLSRIVTQENDKISKTRIVTEEGARDQAIREAKSKAGVLTSDKEDFGMPREQWIEQRTQEIVDEAKGTERSLMKRVLSVINKKTTSSNKSAISASDIKPDDITGTNKKTGQRWVKRGGKWLKILP